MFFCPFGLNQWRQPCRLNKTKHGTLILALSRSNCKSKVYSIALLGGLRLILSFSLLSDISERGSFPLLKWIYASSIKCFPCLFRSLGYFFSLLKYDYYGMFYVSNFTKNRPNVYLTDSVYLGLYYKQLCN